MTRVWKTTLIKLLITFFLLAIFLLFAQATSVSAFTSIDDFVARPPIHIHDSGSLTPRGLTPSQIKNSYHLPQTGGSGTIALIDAFDYPTAEQDLRIFSRQFNLPECTKANGCFEQVKIDADTRVDNGWSGEAALDTQWAHAIAPSAKILLVEAKSASGRDLLKAIDFAKGRSDVVAVSMSFGGPEFPQGASLDQHFDSSKAVFFASAGDRGHGVEWPAVSIKVVGVGGTSLKLTKKGLFQSESAWKGSGGGVSKYVSQPDFQKSFGISDSKKFRSVPDVSYNADPASGYSVYLSTGQTGWLKVGGTSAGAPQWAAIRALGLSASNPNFYRDGASSKYKKYFRDISRGLNGLCLIFCQARAKYDFVTGLGSPLTTSF